MKDILPDLGNEFCTGDEDVKDSIDFILKNLSEMNRLWIRLQYINKKKDPKGREAEREQLWVTVGENISRLSSLHGVNEKSYKDTVLPSLLETIVACNDTMSQ